MNKPITARSTVCRRSFVKGAAGLTFAFAFGGALLGRSSEALRRRRRQAQRLGDASAPTAPSPSSARPPRWGRAC